MNTQNANRMDIEQLVEIVVKRRWVLIGSFILAMITGIILALTLPKLYEAQTLILIQPQRVPTDYVRSVVSSDIDERITTISQQIMSRTNLEKVIRKFDLYSDQNRYMEDQVATMRKRITVDVTRDNEGADAFSIAFRGKDPQKVMLVTNALATFFIDENIKVREASAVGTSDFLQEELEAMQGRLSEMEQRLKTFRIDNMGVLPEQLETNLRILERLQNDLNAKQLRLRDARQLQLSLERLIAEAESMARAAPRNEQPAVDIGQMDLPTLKATLESLRSRYTSRHPDVIRVERQIEKLQQERNRTSGGAETAPDGTAAAALPGGPIFGNRQDNLPLQLEAAKREIALLEFEIPQISEKIKTYQQRVEKTPRIEQELSSLQRNYENIKKSYESLLQRKLEAEMSVNLEKKQKGEQFRVIDQARVPINPVLPNMQTLFFIAVAAGLGLGLGLISLLESMDRSYRYPEEIESDLDLKVLAMVPIIETAKIRWMKRTNVLFTIFFIVLAFGLLGGFASLTLIGEHQTLQYLQTFVSI